MYTIVGLMEESDKKYAPERLIQVEKTEYRAFIIQGDEIELYVESTIEHMALTYEFTVEQQEKLCSRYGKDIDEMIDCQILELLSFHLDNVLAEGLE